MKNITHLTSLLVAAVLVFGCKSPYTFGTADTFKTGAFDTETVEYSYSGKVLLKLAEPVEDQDSTEVLVKLGIDYPKDNGNNIVAVHVIRKCINEFLSFYNGFEKVYDGNQGKAQEVADFYGNSFKEYFEAQNDFPAPALSYEIEIKKIFENPKCVTYTFMIDMYLGGAHGGRTFYGQTFVKEDGKLLTNFLHIADAGDEGLNRLMKEGLMKNWNLSDEKQLYDYTWEDKVSQYYVASPLHSPCFVEDGVMFCYQEYEIAAYAAGAPVFTIPYSQIEKYLNPFAKELLK